MFATVLVYATYLSFDTYLYYSTLIYEIIIDIVTGQKFAMLEEKSVISTILRHFRIETLERLEDITLMNELILRPESGLKVKLFLRDQI